MTFIVSHCESSNGRLFSADYPSIETSVVVELISSTLELAPKDVEDVFLATPMQTDVHYALASDPQAFSSQTVYDLEGDFDLARFTQALYEVAVANTTLRTVFVITSNAKVYQVVTGAPQAIVLPTLTLDENSSSQDLCPARSAEPAWIYSPRPLDASNCHSAGRQHLSYHLVWMAHDSILDGLSINLLTDDIWSVYTGALAQMRPSTKLHADALQRDLATGETFLEAGSRTAPLAFKEIKQQASCAECISPNAFRKQRYHICCARGRMGGGSAPLSARR
ncbi:hypothetical protein HDU86_000878 [Geranomyces michiganensis]|nr:hypothetical protein HDU86_000878 [Geranomyces michiganensis]